MIQTGYGLAGKSPQVVLEGLANYYHQYSPSFPDDPNNPKRNDLSKFGHGKTELLDILEKLRDTKGMLIEVVSNFDELTGTGCFSVKISVRCWAQNWGYYSDSCGENSPQEESVASLNCLCLLWYKVIIMLMKCLLSEPIYFVTVIFNIPELISFWLF